MVISAVDSSLRTMPEFQLLEHELGETEKRQYGSPAHRAEACLYTSLVINRFGRDFRGIFPFGSSDSISFCGGIPEGYDSVTRIGHWDYADIAYRKNYGLTAERREELQRAGLVNPDMIPEHGFFVQGPSSNVWDTILKPNKSVRLVHWAIGNWPLEQGQILPEDIIMGTYQIAFLQSDNSGYKCAPRLAADLVRPGGLIIARTWNRYLRPKKFEETGKVRPILHDDRLFYSAFERFE